MASPLVSDVTVPMIVPEGTLLFAPERAVDIVTAMPPVGVPRTVVLTVTELGLRGVDGVPPPPPLHADSAMAAETTKNRCAFKKARLTERIQR
jgi:hypothetical protein